MPTEHQLVLLLLFLVTLGDHAGIPNLYVITLILAEGKGFNPYWIFASAFASITLYEVTLFWLGRWMRTHRVRENRLLRYVTQSTAAVSRLLSDRSGVWLVFGRFMAFVGLYVPFAAGQMGRSFPVFLGASLAGTLLQLIGFGIPAYLLGKPFEGIVQRIPLIPISVGFMLIVVGLQAVIRYRRARRRHGLPPASVPTAPSPRSTRQHVEQKLEEEEGNER